MSRQVDLEDRDRSWRDLARAGAWAAAVTLLLVVSVGLVWVWLLGQAPSEAPALGAPIPSTPTPRALFLTRATPPLAPPAVIPTAPAIITVEETEEPTAAAIAATPDILTLSAEDIAAPASDVAIFEAPGEAGFTALASGSWGASDDALINPGSNAVAEPWLKLTSAPSAAFAVEAEIRVKGVLDSVCDQSFGLVGGSPGGGQMYGGGVHFPCGSDAARARLTDVAVWQDGYNADVAVAEDAFDPGQDWHTYRFELRSDRLRLIVDGVGIVSGSPATAVDPAASDAEAGIWAQGVELEVRSVAVYPLPPG